MHALPLPRSRSPAHPACHGCAPLLPPPPLLPPKPAPWPARCPRSPPSPPQSCHPDDQPFEPPSALTRFPTSKSVSSVHLRSEISVLVFFPSEIRALRLLRVLRVFS